MIGVADVQRAQGTWIGVLKSKRSHPIDTALLRGDRVQEEKLSNDWQVTMQWGLVLRIFCDLLLLLVPMGGRGGTAQFVLQGGMFVPLLAIAADCPHGAHSHADPGRGFMCSHYCDREVLIPIMKNKD